MSEWSNVFRPLAPALTNQSTVATVEGSPTVVVSPAAESPVSVKDGRKRSRAKSVRKTAKKPRASAPIFYWKRKNWGSSRCFSCSWRRRSSYF